MSLKNTIHKYISNINNIYLIIIILILLSVILAVIVIDFSDKNIVVQSDLSKIHNKIKKMKNIQYKNGLINPQQKVKHVNNIIVIEDFLQKDFFLHMRKQFNDKTYESKDVILRKATGINLFKLHQQQQIYPGILELFYSDDLIKSLSSAVNKPAQRVSLSDPNACSLLIYTNKGDHIDWHYDYSNYYGDRFVVLLTIVNENSSKNGLSENIFNYKYKDKTHGLQMKENSVVIFKGSDIHHKATSIGDNERRIILSMVFCDICQEKQKNAFNILYEKIKNSVLYNND